MVFTELVGEIKKRPEMYLSKNSIYYLHVFITGYECGCETNVNFRLFSYWLEQKYKICNTLWSWSRILHHVAGCQEKALFLFFSEFENYLRALNENNVPKTRVEFDVPNESVTNEYWGLLHAQKKTIE